MTQQELLVRLHQYTPFELFCKENYSELSQDPSYIKNYLVTGQPVSEPDSLHFPTPQIEYSLDGFHSEQFSTYTRINDVDTEKIVITQHDRYTLPILHNHNFYEILYVYEGEFNHIIDHHHFTMRTGDICLVPPNVYHSLNVNNYSIVLNILIHIDTFRDIFLNVLTGDNILSSFFLGNIYSRNVNDYIIFHTNGDITIQNIFLTMCLESLNRKKYYRQFLHTNLLLLFGHLLRDFESKTEMPQIKKKNDILDYAVLKFMDDHYKDVTLAMLSEKFHYSPQQMSNRIKRITGKNFTSYVLSLRMQKAADLLKNTDMKIKDICMESGYNTQEHFIRTFHNYYHTSPSAYRDSMK